MTYERRVVDQVLDELFPDLAAIALEGAKGVGKTATASQRARTILALDEPSQREALAANRDLLDQVPTPVLIDEWQLEPTVWDRVRRSVDADPSGGRFLLTGSAGIDPSTRVHSGAGRIVSLTMRPWSIAERQLETSTVSLKQLLTGSKPDISGTSRAALTDYVDEILRSGFPGIRGLPERARGVQLDSYLSRIVERDLPEAGIAVRRPAQLMAWLAAYGAATATNATYKVILDAATPGEPDKPARQTVAQYREHLERLFVLDPVPAWLPTGSTLKRLTLAPKHHLVDPALAARLRGIDKLGLLRGDGTPFPGSAGSWLGSLFESLVAQSVRVYSEGAGARVGHLRTHDTEREVDLIVEANDQSVVAIEVKLAPSVGDADVRHLRWLGDQLGDRLADAVVITTGPFAYRRSDGIAVVPLTLLGP